MLNGWKISGPSLASPTSVSTPIFLDLFSGTNR